MWLVCCCLLPPCYFHRLFTSGADEQDWKQGSQITSRATTDKPLTVTAMEVKGKDHDEQTDEQEEELYGGGSVPGLHAAQGKF